MPSKKSEASEKVNLLSLFKSDISDSSSTINACSDLNHLQDQEIAEMEAKVAALNDQIKALRKSRKDIDKAISKRDYFARAKYLGLLVYSSGISFEDFPVVVGIANLLAHGISNLDKDYADFLMEMRHNGEEFIAQNKFDLSDAPSMNLDDFKKEISDSLASEKEKKVTTPKSKKPKKVKKKASVMTDNADAVPDEDSISAGSEAFADTSSVEENHGSSFSDIHGPSDEEGAVVNG